MNALVRTSAISDYGFVLAAWLNVTLETDREAEGRFITGIRGYK